VTGEETQPSKRRKTGNKDLLPVDLELQHVLADMPRKVGGHRRCAAQTGHVLVTRHACWVVSERIHVGWFERPVSVLRTDNIQ